MLKLRMTLYFHSKAGTAKINNVSAENHQFFSMSLLYHNLRIIYTSSYNEISITTAEFNRLSMEMGYHIQS